MLSRLYNALWYPALPVAMLASGAVDRESRAQRRGRVSLAAAALTGRPRLWMHAASVGEIEAARPIAVGLVREMPEAALIVTTMTATGREAARRRIPQAQACVLAPFDHLPAVRSFLGSMRPNLVLIAETELWPNYFFEANRLGARIALINGRLSARSLRGYLRARPLFAAALQCARLVLTQSQADADRFAELGAPRERIVVAGNTKFDFDPGMDADWPLRYERFFAGRPVLIAGSTAAGEDQIVLEAYVLLRQSLPSLALVIAPRHPERAAEVALLLGRNGSFARASQFDLAPEDASIMLLDTMGELRAMYAQAAVAVVGGSMVKGRGGQNLAEPALAGVPVLFGPFHRNQSEVASAILAARGGQVVSDAPALASAARDLLADAETRRAVGRRAREAVLKMGGAAQRSLELLRPLLTVGLPDGA